MSLNRFALALPLGCALALLTEAAGAQPMAAPPPAGDPVVYPRYAAEPPPPPAPIQDSGWFAGQRGLTFKGGAGFAYRHLFDISIVGADIAIGLGAQTRSGGWFGNAGLVLGKTEGGLFTRQVSVGASWEAPLDELHLGVGIGASHLSFDRVTTSNSIVAIGIGANLFATYDLYTGDDTAVFVGVKGTVDYYTGDDEAVLVGGSAGLGLRFF
jgi:hypothetical protein